MYLPRNTCKTHYFDFKISSLLSTGWYALYSVALVLETFDHLVGMGQHGAHQDGPQYLNMSDLPSRGHIPHRQYCLWIQEMALQNIRTDRSGENDGVSENASQKHGNIIAAPSSQSLVTDIASSVMLRVDPLPAEHIPATQLEHRTIIYGRKLRPSEVPRV